MTKGKPFPIIIRFCIPVLLGNVFQQMYVLADAFIIGKFIGLDEMGAVLSTGSLYFLVIGFVIGLTAGFSIPVSGSFGAGDIPEMRKRVANAFYLCGFFSVALTALTMIFIRPLLEIMKTPAETIDDAYDYIIVLFGSITIIVAYNMLFALLRALGDSKTPLFFLIIGVVLNILFDLLFIIVFKWGTSGAGWALVVSMALEVVFCLIYIRKNYPVLHFSEDELKLCRKRCGVLVKNGVPMALQFSITAVGSVIIQWAVNGFGVVVVSAVGIAARIQIFIMQPMEALGITMATYCAQNLGARKLHRIKKGIRLSMIAVLCYSVFAGLLIVFAGGHLALFITGVGADGYQEAKDMAGAMVYIRKFQLVNGCLYWLLGILFVIRNSIQGLGYSKITVLAGVSELAARAGIAFALVPFFEFNAICFANPLAWLFADIMLIVIFIILMKKLPERIK